MRCISFCTAVGYQLPLIADFFRLKHYAVTTFRNDVLQVVKPNDQGEMFFFNHGCFVVWGLTKEQEREVIELIKPFSIDPLEKIEMDCFIYRLGQQTEITPHPDFSLDIITLDEKEANTVQIKLAISYGLAQSIKLESYEESITKTVAASKSLSEELARKGKISLSRKAISKRIGEIFLERRSINLSSEYLDVPEYFWRYSNLESYYIMIEEFLDISKRVTALNHRLDVLHETFEMLNNQLQHRYSSILEAIIIVLIAIEIFIHLVFHV